MNKPTNNLISNLETLKETKLSNIKGGCGTDPIPPIVGTPEPPSWWPW